LPIVQLLMRPDAFIAFFKGKTSTIIVFSCHWCTLRLYIPVSRFLTRRFKVILTSKSLVQGDIDFQIHCSLLDGHKKDSLVCIFDVCHHPSLADATVNLEWHHVRRNTRNAGYCYWHMLALGAYDMVSTYAPNKWPGMKNAMTHFPSE
jgi:hypothetical protein